MLGCGSTSPIVREGAVHAIDRTLDSEKIPHNSWIILIPPSWVLGGRTASPLDSLTLDYNLLQFPTSY